MTDKEYAQYLQLIEVLNSFSNSPTRPATKAELENIQKVNLKEI